MVSTAPLAAAADESPDAATALADRAARWGSDLESALRDVYGEAAPLDTVWDLIGRSHRERPEHLRRRDRQRLLQPDWYQLASTIGYSCYVDRFARTLDGVRARIPYLRELGVTFLHLMPLLLPRDAPNDGGYAVVDFRTVRPDLGTMDDLSRLAADLHTEGISLTLDLVLNHVAAEHPWAEKARSGDPRYRRYFHLFEDRTLPDQYEQTLPTVFPVLSPGSFTWDERAHAWVWTTFHQWQWDLDWSNPDVFCEFAEIVLFLANQGVDCLRLDSLAFLWKRLGTDCRNQPEVHAIVQALRAVARIGAPSLTFVAEAIVGGEHVTAYLGRGRRAGRVSELAYDNTLMMNIWASLATGDAAPVVQSRRRFAAKPVTTAWVTYLRCHDDIVWAVDDADAAAVGMSRGEYVSFLTGFFAGRVEGSYARGVDFQEHPETGDRGTSGTAASLVGLEAGLEAGSAGDVDRALDRLLCAYSIVFGIGGLPVLYMGDELALLNDYSYLEHPEHAGDSRWVHRPLMPWGVADQRLDPTTVVGRVFTGIRRLAAARGSLESLHAAVESEVLQASTSVAAAVRRHPSGTVVELYNVSDVPQTVQREQIATWGVRQPFEWISQSTLEGGEALTLMPYAAWWLVEQPRG